MKAERLNEYLKNATPKPVFEPVVLVLETQGEVDAIFSLINHRTLATCAGLSLNSHECLLTYRSAESSKAIYYKLQGEIVT